MLVKAADVNMLEAFCKCPEFVSNVVSQKVKKKINNYNSKNVDHKAASVLSLTGCIKYIFAFSSKIMTYNQKDFLQFTHREPLEREGGAI